MFKKSVLKRVAAVVGLTFSGEYLCQATGCITPFSLESTATATDFCFIFDCQNGLFGGTIDPCSGNPPTFLDCPDEAP